MCYVSARESRCTPDITSLLSSGGAFTTTVEVAQRPSEGYEMHQFNTMDSQGMEERARSEPPQVSRSFGACLVQCNDGRCRMASVVCGGVGVRCVVVSGVVV